jgi:1-acyl-sn-glycerol-3-phosphate acyltransferase
MKILWNHPVYGRKGDMSRFYWCAMVFLRWLLRTFFACQVRGVEYLPRGGALIVANHVSVLDPEFICAAARDLDLSWLAKKPLFDMPVLGRALHLLRTIPLNQEAADFTAFREALARMERGYLVGIFPEGGISKPGAERTPQPGVAVLAHMAGRPVVPVAITGTARAVRWEGWRPVFSTVWIRFGEPLEPPAGRLNKEGRRRFTLACMAAIDALDEANRAEEAGLLATGDRRIPASRV